MKPTILLVSAVAIGLSACASSEPTPAPGTKAAAAAAVNADIDALGDLAAIAIDAGALYREAAEITTNPDLGTELTTLAAERDALTNEIQTQIKSMGAEPRTKGTALGFGHRIFTDIRSAFDNNQQTAAGEVLRGENFLLDEMQKTLADPQLTAETKAFVRGLIPGVEAARDRVNALVLQYRKAG